MILADENLPVRFVQSLRSSGVDVYFIREHKRGINDEEVIALSKNPPRIILTEDKEFGEWVFAHNEKQISIILLRYKISELDEIIEVVSDLIRKRGKNLYGKYTTVTRNKIRIREIKN
jgi:predicted nuclease of predicted toxin-antitoxin system